LLCTRNGKAGILQEREKKLKVLKVVCAIFCFTAMTVVLSPGANAQTGDYNSKTTVTFSVPVEIPGVSSVRLQRTDKTVITFRERPNGEPRALRPWFYPAATWGDEFVYPKAKAREIAQATSTPVLYSQDETTPSEVSEPIQPPTTPEVTRIDSAPIMAYNPAGEEVELAQAVTPPPPDMQASNTPAPAPTPAPAQLPQTGSQLALTILAGLLALGGAECSTNTTALCVM
jgi:hypothetical protein